MSYQPKWTWVQGEQYPHPAGREAFVAEVHRILSVEWQLDSKEFEKLVPGGFADAYDTAEWCEDPHAYALHLSNVAIRRRAAQQLARHDGAASPPPEPVVRPLWRLKRAERKDAARAFVGHRVRLERWYGRVAADGDETYRGRLVAVATTTVGTSADLAILETDEGGTVWAISLAQVARLEAL